MGAKQLTFDVEAREKIRGGVDKLVRAVASTMGPKGRTALLDKGWGAPNVTKDGVTVAEEIDLKCKYENCGAQMVREVASKTSDVAGDGTTTATVLAGAIFNEGLRYETAGHNPAAINRGIHFAVSEIIKALEKQARPVDGQKDIQFVAAVAANNDKSVGKIIAEAQEKVGKDGVITVDEGKSAETEIKVVEGMQFDRGYLSAQFITDQKAMKAELENCYVLIHEDKITNVQKLVPILEKVSKSGKPLLIIAETIEGEALATLVVNKLRGILPCCAVKAPGYGDRRKAMLEDLAILTGAKAIMTDLGIDLAQIDLKDLGRAKKVIIDNDNTTVIEGAGSKDQLKGRIAQIRKEIETTTSDYDREKLQERLAKLAGGIAEVRVGAPTETEMKELKARVEDALHATRAAMEGGILPGGGVALLRASEKIAKLKTKNEDEQIGVDIVRAAISRPIKQIAENAGKHGAVIAAKVLENKSESYGWDALNDKYGDMFDAGIVDPAKVTISALQNAASVASMLLTTDCIITAKQDESDDDHED
ncbi:MAG: chaperonin GroEL [Planctomycetaceae bacterium]|nr:chaperonin GroEL [Planctomycetaceae bacterium]